MRICAMFVLLLAPTSLIAGCGHEDALLISCTFNDGAKTVTTCMNDQAASYSFGPTGGKAELELTRDIVEVDMLPWQGFGRWISEAIVFENGAYKYALRYAIDKLAEEPTIEGDFWVGKGETRLAELICDPGSVETSGYPLPLYDAKIAAGQIYSFDDYEWTIRD